MPKVLIADDSLSVLKVGERLLTQAGFEVVKAKSGEEALACLGKERPDLIISDVFMPDKTGYEVSTFVRSHADLAEIPVLLISGIINEEISRQAESSGANGVLKKPFQGTALKDRVLELIANRQEGTPSSGASKVKFSTAPDQGRVIQITMEQFQTFSLAVSRTKELEASLVTDQKGREELDATLTSEREAASRSIQDLETALAMERERVTELTGQLAHAETTEARLHEVEGTLTEEREAAVQSLQALEATLATEREGVNVLTERLDTAEARLHEMGGILTEERETAAQSLQALEAPLVTERERVTELTERLTQAEAGQARLRGLEAVLARERDMGTQSIQQLEAALASEREQVYELTERLTKAETTEARLRMVEGTLTTERDAAAQLVQQLKDMEKAADRVKELEALLGQESDKTSQLSQTLTEKERVFAQVRLRQEEVSRKIAEVVHLAQ